MPRTVARDLATSWKVWVGLLLLALAVLIEVGLLPRPLVWVILAAVAANLLYPSAKTLRAKRIR